MEFIDKINNAIKQAMLAKDSRKLGALRAVKSEILKEQTKEGGNGEMTEEVGIKILQRLVKQRRDAAEIYTAQSRQDLADDELFQASILDEYLPKQMSDDELRIEINHIIERLGVKSTKEIGKVMGIASKELSGKADNKRIQQVASNELKIIEG